MPHLGDRPHAEAPLTSAAPPPVNALPLTAAQRTLLEHVAREVQADTISEALNILISRHSQARASAQRHEANSPPDGARFMTIPALAEELSTTTAQVYALVHSGELPAIKVGGRGQWRIERTRFEAWVNEQYGLTRAFLLAHPYPSDTDKSDGGIPRRTRHP